MLPKPIRRALRWVAGTRLVVESTSDGVLLKPEPSFPETRPEDVFGSLAYDGKPKTVQEMNAVARGQGALKSGAAPTTQLPAGTDHSSAATRTG